MRRHRRTHHTIPKTSSRVQSLIGKLSKLRGLENEERFFSAFDGEDPDDVPYWWKGIRRATRHEDYRSGIDAVLSTDMGDIYYQIKSSYTGLRSFLMTKREHHIIPLVIGPLLSVDDIREMVESKARAYRKSILKNVKKVSDAMAAE